MSEQGEISLDDTFDDEINDDERNLPEQSMSALVSPAHTLVEMAAYQINLEPSKMKFLVHIMKEELITELWQLQYMDSANWREMGFPIGLVASIRRQMHENDMAESDKKLDKRGYGFNGFANYEIGNYAAPLNDIGSHAFHAVPRYSHASTMNTEGGDDESPATEPKTPALSLELPKAQNETNPKRAARETANMKRISDITLSERLSSRIHISPHHPKPKLGSSNIEGQAIKASMKDQPPVSAPRRSSRLAGTHSPPRSPARSPTRSSTSSIQHNADQVTCLRASMPVRPLRRPTLHDTPNNMKFELDDLSHTQSFFMESVGMLIAGSKETETKRDHNASMAVIAGSMDDMRDLFEGPESIIEEVGERESKLTEGSNNGEQDPSMSTRSSTLPHNASLLRQQA